MLATSAGGGAAPDPRAIEARAREIGREILEVATRSQPGPLTSEWVRRKLTAWTTRDPRLRTQLFRFVDVLPALRTRREVAERLREYLLDESEDGAGGGAIRAALRLVLPGAPTGALAAMLARTNARMMARGFIAGERLDEAVRALDRLRRDGLAFTLDLLGEAVTSDAQAEEKAQAYIEMIDQLAPVAARWAPDASLDIGPGGAALPRVNISIKLSSLEAEFEPVGFERAAGACSERLRPILRRARATGAFVNVDMEQYALKGLTQAVFKSVMMEPEFADWPDVGVVLQGYLLDSAADLEAWIEWGRRRSTPFWIRLVKGAYWDYETIMAGQRGWPSPVFARKWETDANFERLTARLFEAREITRPAIASHNARSLAVAAAHADALGLAPTEYEFQTLYGMGDELKRALVGMGRRVRVYTPYGPLIPGMAYLIRRLLENTSNESFLLQTFTGAAEEELLAAPHGPTRTEHGRTRTSTEGEAEMGMRIETLGGGREEEHAMPFMNEPMIDFSIAENREAMRRAIKRARGNLGRDYPPVIAGERVAPVRWVTALNPSRTTERLARVGFGDAALADRAVSAAARAWPEWRRLPVRERADYMRRAAEIMKSRRFDLAAWLTLEVGKPWIEADAEVAEAIDFLRFYAGEMERLDQAPRRRDAPGEENLLVYESRGVAAVIAPWNFPLAILTGMTAAALVTGATVVIKPAEQSSVIAARMFEILEEAGLPPGVANFLPGLGEEVGARLTSHPDVATVAFTGSREVGLKLIEQAGRMAPGRRTVMRVIAEMGGKNAIIVDADADLDEAVHAIARSAFGFAGQKCSACSRVIAIEPVHDALVKRLAETTRSLTVGPTDDPATVIGPLIDKTARDRVMSYIERGRGEGRVICEVNLGEMERAEELAGGWFVGPVIFDDVPASATIAREEIFGPALAVMRARDFDHALELANATEYGLTGGVFSRSPAHIERAMREFHVGNLYINRGITGALVDRQPFGGMGLSGVGAKAGGPDYLRQFCDAKAITENTMRRGFAPEAA